MAEIKTKKNIKLSAAKYIAAVEQKRRADAQALLKLFMSVTKKKPVMWGTSIVGFDEYHYESERSAQKGDWPLTGFSVRAQNFTLYIMLGFKNYGPLLRQLGPHKTSVGCLYIKRLSDVNEKVLRTLIATSYTDAKKTYAKK